MKYAVLLVISILFTACQPQNRGQKEAGTLPRTIVARIRTSDQIAQGIAGSQNDQTVSEDQTPKVPIKQNEFLLSLINVNLDLDKTDEQILILKDRDDLISPIRVALVDFDEIRESYTRTWEHATQATNQRLFKVETEDLIGDYNIEIICRGINQMGELTLDVFRKTTSPSGLGLYFSPICQLVSDRRITIQREKRPQAYQLGQKYGQSFPIILERSEPESEKNLDIIRETYYWKYQEKKYIKSLEEKIPGEEIKQKQLKMLFSGQSTQKDFEEFLNGPWFMENRTDNLVIFDPDDSEIKFYDGNVLEIYNIEDFALHGNRLSLIARNNTINSIKKWIIIAIKSNSSIEINSSNMDNQSINDSGQWEGKYDRLTDELQDGILRNQNRQLIKYSDSELTGIYRSTVGLEIAFEPPYFTWLENSSQGNSGGFYLLTDVPLLNAFYLEREIPDRVDVINFRFLEHSGIHIKDWVYVLEYKVRSEDNTTVKTIQLTPAKLLVSGVVLTSKESITLEQIEISQN